MSVKKGNSRKPDKNDAGREDYRVYRLSLPERLKYAALYAAADVLVCGLFFSSLLPAVVFLPGVFAFWKYMAGVLLQRREERMRGCFMTGMQFVGTALGAGNSIENAFREGEDALRRLYGTENEMTREFGYLRQQMMLNRPMEELILDLGERSGVEEIRSFAQVFCAARRSGGDLPSIIRNTAQSIRQRIETMQEIETMLAGRRMEQRVMSVIPLLILLYIRMASPEFLAPLYHNIAGIVVMSIALAVYMLAVFWAGRIMNLRV